jgi:hypothetical protein
MIGLYFAGFLQNGGDDAGYVGQQAALALIMSMVSGPAASPDILPPIDRLTGIAGGIVIVSRRSRRHNPASATLRTSGSADQRVLSCVAPFAADRTS